MEEERKDDKKKDTSCVECDKEGSGYKCPRCRCPYCSLACFKLHKARMHEESEAPVAGGGERQKRNRGQQDDRDDSTREPALDVVEDATQVKVNPHLDLDEDEGEGGTNDFSVLRNRHLRVLSSDPELKEALRTSELQQIIMTIDSSKSPVDALDAALYNVKDFKLLSDKVLNRIYAAEAKARQNK